MSISNTLKERAAGACEICGTTSDSLQAFAVPTRSADSDEHCVAICEVCLQFLQQKNYADANHFRNLVGAIWSEVPAVKVMAYKLLNQLSKESWAAEALDAAYLDESEMLWAQSEDAAEADRIIHKDAYGVVLEAGDTVLLTENLNVKGANFIAPKGTKVPKIRLVPDNAEQIEGKIEGSTIVILTKYVRKSN